MVELLDDDEKELFCILFELIFEDILSMSEPPPPIFMSDIIFFIISSMSNDI